MKVHKLVLVFLFVLLAVAAVAQTPTPIPTPSTPLPRYPDCYVDHIEMSGFWRHGGEFGYQFVIVMKRIGPTGAELDPFRCPLPKPNGITWGVPFDPQIDTLHPRASSGPRPRHLPVVPNATPTPKPPYPPTLGWQQSIMCNVDCTLIFMDPPQNGNWYFNVLLPVPYGDGFLYTSQTFLFQH